MFLFTVFGTIFLVQAVTGVPGSARVVLRGLYSRSLPVIPAACQTGCAPFTPFLSGAACPVTQCCTTIFEAGYFECFKCVGAATNATDYSTAQEYVDVLTTSCTTEGFTLPELTFPGQNADRTLATVLPAGASTVPIFGPGSPASQSGSAISGSASAASQSVTASSASQSAVSGSAVPSASASGSPSSASVAPLSQSTATSPPSQTSAPASTTSAPSNSAAVLPRTQFEAVVGISAFVVTLQMLLV
ncbi:hypothetical protein C8R44DRAFT_784934 [Mycena epipterygia]|nr:hypothetical protein C8R44DRAFT_784934 [Mycena epipterygia]